jgi:hypothetical protein
VKVIVDNAKFVFIAHLLDVKTVAINRSSLSKSPVEVGRATFRVDQPFKGGLKRGEVFKIYSGDYRPCYGGILAGKWIPFPANGKQYTFSYPNPWLIYYTPPAAPDPYEELPPFQVLSPFSRPVRWARYDINVLNVLSGKWASARGNNGSLQWRSLFDRPLWVEPGRSQPGSWH